MRLGRVRQFVIHDPKERIITAPCLEERVLHHAIMNVCEPVFDRSLIDDTFACRVGKGREAAVLRAAQFARRDPAFLKLDVRKYFDSVSHARLLAGLEGRFKEAPLLELFARIVHAYRGSIGRGLPIGSLMSQHFANFHLSWFDRYVKETLRVRGYVRYMDDMTLWGASCAVLSAAERACREFLHADLRLELKPAFVNHTAHGLDFLGSRVFPTHVELSRRSRRRFRRRLRRLERLLRLGLITEHEIQSRGCALTAFAQGAGAKSWHFRVAVLQDGG